MHAEAQVLTISVKLNYFAWSQIFLTNSKHKGNMYIHIYNRVKRASF